MVRIKDIFFVRGIFYVKVKFIIFFRNGYGGWLERKRYELIWIFLLIYFCGLVVVILVFELMEELSGSLF